LLYGRIGHTISPKSGREVQKDTPKTVVETLFKHAEKGTKFYVLCPVPHHEGNDLNDEFQLLKEKGLTRLLNIEDEEMVDLASGQVNSDTIDKDNYRIIIDRLGVKKDDENRQRLVGSVETAFREGRGRCSLKIRNNDLDKIKATSKDTPLNPLSRGDFNTSTDDGPKYSSGSWKNRIIPYNSKLKNLARQDRKSTRLNS